MFKKQISEYHGKLETETKRADKLEFETKKLLEQLEGVKVRSSFFVRTQIQLAPDHNHFLAERSPFSGSDELNKEFRSLQAAPNFIYILRRREDSRSKGDSNSGP